MASAPKAKKATATGRTAAAKTGRGRTARERTYWDTARRLARFHRRVDPQTSRIFVFPNGGFDNVQLLEVSKGFANTGDVLAIPYKAMAAKKIRIASTVILLAPGEWKDVRDGKLPLPPGWDLDARVEI